MAELSTASADSIDAINGRTISASHLASSLMSALRQANGEGRHGDVQRSLCLGGHQ